MRAHVSEDTVGAPVPLSTIDTAACETPASLATSFCVGRFMGWFPPAIIIIRISDTNNLGLADRQVFVRRISVDGLSWAPADATAGFPEVGKRFSVDAGAMDEQLPLLAR